MSRRLAGTPMRLNQIASVPFGEISSWLKPAWSKNANDWSRETCDGL